MSDYVMFLLIPQVSVADERMLDMHGPLTSTMEIEMLCRKVLKRIQYSTYKILLPTSVSLSQLNAPNPLVFEMLKQPPVVLWPKGSWYPQGTPPLQKKKHPVPSRSEWAGDFQNTTSLSRLELPRWGGWSRRNEYRIFLATVCFWLLFVLVGGGSLKLKWGWWSCWVSNELYIQWYIIASFPILIPLLIKG